MRFGRRLAGAANVAGTQMVVVCWEINGELFDEMFN